MSIALLDTILDDIKQAMKNHEKEKLMVLRTLHADIKNVEQLENKTLSEELVVKVVAKNIKQRQDTIPQFEAGQRQDLVAKAKQELAWLGTYMPAALSPAELEQLARQAIAESGATSKKDLGKAMKVMMALVKGRADGKLVSETVGKLLP